MGVFELLGGVLLRLSAQQAWNKLSYRDLQGLVSEACNDMALKPTNYNKVYKNRPSHLNEIFSDEDLLEEIGQLLTNGEEVVQPSTVDIILRVVDDKAITKLDIEQMLNDFIESFFSKLYLNPQLRDGIMIKAIYHLSKSQRRVLSDHVDAIEIRAEGASEGYTDVGGITQFRVLAYEFHNLLDSVRKQSKLNSNNKFTNIQRRSENEYHATYQIKSSFNGLEVSDSPFKVIYPHVEKVKVWFRRLSKNRLEIIEITIFTSTPSVVRKLASAIHSMIPDDGTLQQGHFHRSMKKFVTANHSHSIYALKFDPDIMQQIEESEGIMKDIKVSQETLYGDSHLPELDEVKKVLDNISEFNNDNTSKIILFKARKDAKLIKKCITTFMLAHDGRLLCWFRNDQFPNELEKFEALHKWYVKNADFNMITPRRLNLN